MKNSNRKTSAYSAFRIITECLRRSRTYITVLSCLVVFTVTYLLILPAVTLDQNEAEKQGGIDLPTQTQQEEIAEAEEQAEPADSISQADEEDDATVENQDLTENTESASEELQENDADEDASVEEAQAADQNGQSVLSASGKGYEITVSYGEDAGIPEGTELNAEEIAFESDDYLQYLGRLWSEMNKEYAKVEKMRENYDESMGELPDAHFVNINAARFFDVTLLKGDKKVEPKAPVQVEIKYDQELDIPDELMQGVVHYISDKKLEIIEDPEISSGNEETCYSYEQGSFSVVGTYVGQETNDMVTEPNLSSDIDPNGSPSSKDVNLSDDVIEDIIRANAKSSKSLRAAGEQSSDADDSELDHPVADKKLKSNGDGTYTLSLSVKGHSSVTEETVAKKSNILFVMDRSSSMITNTVNDENTRWYYGTKNTSSWRGDLTENNGYHFIGIVNGQEVSLNVNYQWPSGSYNNPAITYQSGTDWWGNPQYSPYPDDAPIYVESKKTRMTAEQEALGNLFNQLLAKNDATGENSDIVELSIISFGDQRFDLKSWSNETESNGWTGGRDPSPLTAVTSSNRYTSGTNWEEALEYAGQIINAKKQADGDDEDYYVVFLTDGEPTAIHGESGGAHHTGTNGNRDAYDAAKDDAKNLVDNGVKFYNIFTYRKQESETYSVYLTNYAYGNGNYNDDKTTEAVTQYYNDAQTPDDVVNALNNIFYTVEDAIGHANVSITDTLTTDAMTTTVVHGKTNGYVYEVKDSSGTVLYTVTATGDVDNPTVTFNVPGSSTKDYTATATEIGGKKVYSVTTAEGKIYKMALADVNDTTGELAWDLSPVGMLMDNCTYSVNFVVWPDQDAYDYVAALNNGLTSIKNSKGETVQVKWDQQAATDSGKGYYEGGVADYPSIVKYPNGTYAVLTNKEQQLHYSVVETVTENGETTTTTNGPYYTELPLPDPMPLTASRSSVEKIWNVDRDPSALYRLLYESKDEDHNPVPYGLDFEIKQGSQHYTDVSFLGAWNEDHEYDWGEIPDEDKLTYQGKTFSKRWVESFSIATGLMLSETRMDALGMDKTAYPSANYNGTKYYILEQGHDYTISEPGLSYEFDFESPVYHPMIVDGQMKSVNFTKNGETITIDKITAIETDENGVSALKVENTLRGYLHLNKVVVDEEGHEVPSDNTKFSYTITMQNDGAPFEGDHIPWYGINGLFYHDADFNYYQAEPTDPGHLRLRTEDGETYDATCSGTFNPDIVGPTAVTYTAGGEQKTIQLYGNQSTASSDHKTATATMMISQTEVLNIANVPAGTTYSITETQTDGYDLVKVEREIKDGDKQEKYEDLSSYIGTGEVSGTIVANRDNHITYYNRSLVTDMSIQKLDDDGNGLPGAVFELKKVGDDGHSETPASQIGSVKGLSDITKDVDGVERTFTGAIETTGGVQTITGLPDGTYRLYETFVPAGYISTYQYIEFKVQNRIVKDVTTDTGDNSKLDFAPASGSGSSATIALLQITNTPGAALPSSGGPGTTWIYLLGSLLLLGSGVLLAARRRTGH